MEDRDTPRKPSRLRSVGRFFAEVLGSMARESLWALRIGGIGGAVLGAGGGFYFFGIEGFAIGLFAGAIIGALAFLIFYVFATSW